MEYKFNPRLMWKIIQRASVEPQYQKDYAMLKYECDGEEYYVDVVMTYEPIVEGKPELFGCAYHIRRGHHNCGDYFLYVKVFYSGKGDNWGADCFVPDYKIFYPTMFQLTNWTIEDLDHHMTVLALIV